MTISSDGSLKWRDNNSKLNVLYVYFTELQGRYFYYAVAMAMLLYVIHLMYYQLIVKIFAYFAVIKLIHKYIYFCKLFFLISDCVGKILGLLRESRPSLNP